MHPARRPTRRLRRPPPARRANARAASLTRDARGARRVPLVTRFYGACQDRAHIYLVMELCPGGDLLDLLLREGRAMDERRVAAAFAAPLLTALSRMHALHVIHRCGRAARRRRHSGRIVLSRTCHAPACTLRACCAPRGLRRAACAAGSGAPCLARAHASGHEPDEKDCISSLPKLLLYSLCNGNETRSLAASGQS